MSVREVACYLTFNGNCEEAFKVYEKVLGGKIAMKMTFGEAPGEGNTPPDWKDKIIHIRLMIGDHALMASDAPPGRFNPIKGVFVNLGFKDPKEAERVYKALSKGGEISMPLQETFWSAKFAMFTDRFGTPWMINCEKPQ